MSFFRRVAREPLAHFLLIGALLFGGLTVMKSLRRPVVRLEAQDLNQLASYWEVQMQRPPNKVELAGIIRDRIDEELLAREALRLGLDKDDMIIRRRLAQKMAFATDDVALGKEPSEAELKAYYAKTSESYAAPARVAFQQVFFSGDRPHGGAEKAAAQALERAEEGGRADPTGDPFLFPLAYDDVGPAGPAARLRQDRQGTGDRASRLVAGPGALALRLAHRQGDRPQGAAQRRLRRRPRPGARGLLVERAEANAAFLRSLRKRYRVVVAGVDN